MAKDFGLTQFPSLASISMFSDTTLYSWFGRLNEINAKLFKQ